jgi:phenylacetate-CoA ligase
MLAELITRIAKTREVRRDSKLSRAEFEAHKLERFRRFARHVCDRSPYYAVPTDDLPVNPRTRKFQLIVDKRAA